MASDSFSSKIFTFLDFFKSIISKLLREFTKLKNNVTEDTKALVIVVVFIGWVAFSNYKEKGKETGKEIGKE